MQYHLPVPEPGVFGYDDVHFIPVYSGAEKGWSRKAKSKNSKTDTGCLCF
jgi:hypothetical protein